MQLHIDPHGTLQCVYGEAIDLASLGLPSSAAPATSSRTNTAAGGPICSPWADLGWVRSRFGVKRSTPRVPGWKTHWPTQPTIADPT